MVAACDRAALLQPVFFAFASADHVQRALWLYFRSAKPNPLSSSFILLMQWFLMREMQFSSTRHSVAVVLGSACLTTFLLGVGIDWLWHHGRDCLRMLLLFAAAHCCIFCLALPAAGQGGRYQPMNLLLLFPCQAFGVLVVLRRLFAREVTAFRGTLMLCLGAGVLSLLAWRNIAIDGITVINDSHHAAAAWASQNLPSGTRLAAFDIGRISYEAKDPIIDLSGLVDPDYIPYLLNRRVPEYVREKRVNYLVIPDGGMVNELGLASTPLVKLTEFSAPLDQWSVAFFYTLNAAQCQVLYQTDPGRS